MDIIRNYSEYRLALCSLIFSQELYNLCIEFLINKFRNYLYGHYIKYWLDCVAAYEILLVIEY